jgi:hypothetical protein
MQLVPDHDLYCTDEDILAALNREGKVIQQLTKYYDMNHEPGMCLQL